MLWSRSFLALPSGFGRRIRALNGLEGMYYGDEELCLDNSCETELFPLLRQLSQFPSYNYAMDDCLLDIMLFLEDRLPLVKR